MKNALLFAGQQTVKKLFLGMYEGAAAPSYIIRRGGFAAPRSAYGASDINLRP